MAAHIVGAEPQGAHAECRTKHWNHSHKHNSIRTNRQIQTNICLYLHIYIYISEDTLLKKLMSLKSLTQAQRYTHTDKRYKKTNYQIITDNQNHSAMQAKKSK